MPELVLTVAQKTALAREIRSDIASNPEIRGAQLSLPDGVLETIIELALNKVVDPLQQMAKDAGQFIREKEEEIELRLERETGTKPDLKLNAMATGAMEKAIVKLEQSDKPWVDAAAALARLTLLPQPR